MRAWTFNEQMVSKNAKIIIKKIKGEGDFNLMIQNRDQYKILKSYRYFTCNASVPLFKHISTHYINTSNLPQTFPINPNMGSGKYYFTLYNCIDNLNIQRITFSFLNTWGRLPFEKYPLIYICWIESAFYLVLFILCLVNSLKHTELRVLLHYLIVGTVFVYTLSVIISGVLFTYSNSKGDKGKDINQDIISIIASILLCLRNFCLLVLLLFLVSGLSIVYESIKTSKVILIIASSAAFSVIEFLLDSYVSDSFSFGVYCVVCILFIIIYILYGVLLFFYSYHSLNTLEAHLALIYTANIDPETTPTYRKQELLELLRKCSVAILLFFVGSSILYRMGVFYYFVSYLIIEIAMAVLISVICYNCRLRYKMAATYCDDEEAYIVNDPRGYSTNNQETENQQNLVRTVFQYHINNDDNQPQLQSKSKIKHNGHPKSPRGTNSRGQSRINNLYNPDNQINDQINNQDNDQPNLQQETNNMVSVLTNPYDLNNAINDGETDDRSLSSVSSNSNSEISFEADAGNQHPNGENAGNENDNHSTELSQNERSANTLKKWEYGMLLPPMPNEDYDQNQVHPTD